MKIETPSGLNYELDDDNLTATVIRSNVYGDVFIPRFIEHEGKKYAITSLHDALAYQDVNSISFPEDSDVVSFQKGSFFLTKIKRIQIPPKLEVLEDGWWDLSIKNTHLDFEVSPMNKMFKILDNLFLVSKSSPDSKSYDILHYVSTDVADALIPAQIKVVKSHTFQLHQELNSIIFPEDSELQTIEQNAFGLKTKKLVLPASLENIYCRMGFTNNIDIQVSPKNKVLKMLDGKILLKKSQRILDKYDIIIFAKRDIESIKIPSQVKIISSDSFSNCTELKTVEFEPNSSLRKMETNSFLRSPKLTSLVIPSVNIVGRQAFNILDNLTSVKFLSKTIELDDIAFTKCNKLKLISFPNAKSINFKFADTLKDIPKDAIIEVRKDAELIGKGFNSCQNQIKYIDAPEIKDEIIESNNEEEVENIKYPDLNLKFNKQDFSATVIPSPNLKGNVFIPRYYEHDGDLYAIKEIGQDAFKGDNEIDCVSFPEDSEVESFLSFSFSSSKIKKIQIPPSLKHIDKYAFSSIKESIVFEVSPKSTMFAWVDDKFLIGKFKKTSPTLDTLFYARLDIKDAVIPAQIKVLKSHSFEDRKSLRSLIFPENSELKLIYDDAFRSSSVEKIVLPASVEEIDSHNFISLQYLNHIEVSPKNKFFKSIDNKLLLQKSAPENQFYDILLVSARDVKDVTIDSHIKVISGAAFHCSSELRSFKFEPNSCCEEIKPHSFSNMKSPIKSLTFPQSLKIVGMDSFESSNCLETIEFLSESIKLGSSCFGFAKNISKISFPNATKIESEGFATFLSDTVKLEIRKDAELIGNDFDKIKDQIVYIEPPKNDNNESSSEKDKKEKKSKKDSSSEKNKEKKEKKSKKDSSSEKNKEKDKDKKEKKSKKDSSSEKNKDKKEKKSNKDSSSEKNKEKDKDKKEKKSKKDSESESSNATKSKTKDKLKHGNKELFKHIRFLEKRLMQYEEVVPISKESVESGQFDFNTESDDKTLEPDISQQKSIFIDDEDEENHKIICKIGEGATSVAYKIVDERNNHVMCKKVLKVDPNNPDFKEVQNIIKEFEVLAGIHHPCICRAIGINTQEKASQANEPNMTTVALFLEFLPYSLKNLVGLGAGRINQFMFMNNTLKVKVVVEVAFGLSFIHARGMIHRDLKLENIMLSYTFEAKLIDFGLVSVADPDGTGMSLTKGIGTLAYMSPEMQNEEEYNEKTDVYSFGIVLYAMFTGALPKQSMRDKLNRKPISFPEKSEAISQYCIELMGRCLAFESDERPSFDEILDDMKSNDFALASEVDKEIIMKRFTALDRLRAQKIKE